MLSGMRWLLAGLLLIAAECGTSTTAAPDDPATCEDIRSFAEQVVDVGITYDYEPTSSPAELADRSDAVVLGVLTGESHLVETGDAASNPFVGYELQVREVVGGGPRAIDTVDVMVEFNPAHADLSDYGSVTVPGIPVVVFGSPHPELGERSLVALVMEGLMTACPGEPPRGWVGTDGEWADMDSLPSVFERVRR